EASIPDAEGIRLPLIHAADGLGLVRSGVRGPGREIGVAGIAIAGERVVPLPWRRKQTVVGRAPQREPAIDEGVRGLDASAVVVVCVQPVALLWRVPVEDGGDELAEAPDRHLVLVEAEGAHGDGPVRALGVKRAAGDQRALAAVFVSIGAAVLRQVRAARRGLALATAAPVGAALRVLLADEVRPALEALARVAGADRVARLFSLALVEDRRALPGLAAHPRFAGAAARGADQIGAADLRLVANAQRRRFARCAARTFGHDRLTRSLRAAHRGVAVVAARAGAVALPAAADADQLRFLRVAGAAERAVRGARRAHRTNHRGLRLSAAGPGAARRAARSTGGGSAARAAGVGPTRATGFGPARVAPTAAGITRGAGQATAARALPAGAAGTVVELAFRLSARQEQRRQAEDAKPAGPSPSPHHR